MGWPWLWSVWRLHWSVYGDKPEHSCCFALGTADIYDKSHHLFDNYFTSQVNRLMNFCNMGHTVAAPQDPTARSIQQFWREFSLTDTSTNHRLLGMYTVLCARTRRTSTSYKQSVIRVWMGLFRGRTRMVPTQWWAVLCQYRSTMRRRQVWAWLTLSVRCTVVCASLKSGGTNFSTSSWMSMQWTYIPETESPHYARISHKDFQVN